MKREDVERLLAQADKFGAIAAAGFRSSVPVDPSELRALCERWLLVEDAPAVEADYFIARQFDAMQVGQRVRIIPEGGSDGG